MNLLLLSLAVTSTLAATATHHAVAPGGSGRIVWCDPPDSEKAALTLNSTVHCEHMKVLSSPRDDSIKKMAEKLCHASLHRSVLLSPSYAVVPRHKKKLYGRPAMISYRLLLWSILNLKPDINKDTSLWLEFGVAKAISTNLTSYAQHALCLEQRSIDDCKPSQLPTIYGFDTFEGLPDNWHRFRKGSFSNNGVVPAVESNIELKKGLFNDTVPIFLNGMRNNLHVSMVNIDNDLYEGALFLLLQLKNRFKDGSLIHFHELYHHKRVKEDGSFKVTCGANDEMSALHTFLRENEVNFDLQYIPYYVGHKEPAMFRVIMN